MKTEDTVGAEAVLNDLPELRSGLSREIDSQEAWQHLITGIAGQQWVENSGFLKQGIERTGENKYDRAS